MNKFIKRTVLAAAGAVLVTQTGHAQIAANDLILGFNEQGVSTSDYVVDLGNASTGVGVGGSQVVNLSSAINMSMFNSAFAGAQNGVAMGIAGGNNGTGTKDVFVTQLRTALGNPNSVPGSATPQQPSSANFISTAAGAVNSVSPFGVSPSSGSTSWSTQVAPNASDTTGTPFLNAISVNPMGTISSGTIVQDLYHDNRVGSLGQTGWIYDGYFTLTFLDANTESLTFTPAAFVPVPESATYGLFAGAGLLALSLRRQLVRKSA